jgi:hypothetical protein
MNSASRSQSRSIDGSGTLLKSALFLPFSIFATTLWLLSAAWYRMMTPWLRRNVLTSSKFPEASRFHDAFRLFESFTEGFVRLAAQSKDAAWITSAIVRTLDSQFKVQLTVPLQTAFLGLLIYPTDAPHYFVFQLRQEHDGEYDICPGGFQIKLPKDAGDVIIRLADFGEADRTINYLKGRQESPDPVLNPNNSNRTPRSLALSDSLHFKN